MFDPFNLDNEQDYQTWRENKLAGYPVNIENIIFEINDPRVLTKAEYEVILSSCKKTNMALYASKVLDEDKNIPVKLGLQFGLERLNHNWLADDDAITSLTVNEQGDHPQYIPYTNRPIKWHTDGYYNTADEQIWGLILHCVRPADQGGENRLLDHEIAYIKIRDENPDYIQVLMQDDVMSIPPRMDGDQVARAEETGPVFSVNPVTGNLHMRYTARKRNIHWKDTPLVKAAVDYLETLLESDMPYIYQGRLEPGMGLISNNVLHDRSAFTDNHDAPRLLYRARYFDRINDTGIR